MTDDGGVPKCKKLRECESLQEHDSSSPHKIDTETCYHLSHSESHPGASLSGTTWS